MAENLVESYGWKSAETTYAGIYIAPRILKIIKVLGATRLLDLGSGNGALCSVLADAGYQVVGVEYDLNGVEIAQAAHPAIPFYKFGVQSDPSDLLAHEAVFDVVVSTEVIEHLFSPHLLPLYAKAVLKDRGHLVLTTPYHGYLKNLALAVFGKWDKHFTALWHGGHIKFWSRSTLTKLLESHGFRVVGFSGVGRCPWLWKSMVLVAQKQ
jgi:2-polyprenyl-3-methyl-5-hydroxy-6-metoxy-1,4-benzoquinol methylase